MKRSTIFLIGFVAITALTYLYYNDTTLAESEVLEGYDSKVAEEQYQETIKNNPGAITTNTKLNPAHGQPGHRCDIPVGTSLDAPVKTTNDNTLLSSTMKNPAHGLPGHRCDLAVGAPLPQ
ncbi:hypothetical protein [Robertkochia solimangrovi]|uniref:hypothetical protein n=1 Tax=Robertkochia solimangrovi TaxID=2213046 RepID=UPI0018EF94F4